MHGFRHRFKTVGMEASVPSRILDAIQGHAARTAGDSYGDVTVKAMAMAMERIPRVEGQGVGRTVAEVVCHQKGDLRLSMTSRRRPGDDGGEGGLR